MRNVVRADDDPKMMRLLMIGAAGVVILFVTIVALQALYYDVTRRELEAKTYTVEPRDLHLLRQAQRQKLSQYASIDPEKGIVAIPIERAMELLVREAGGK
ncbi:MAG: hypothetical protein AB1486_02815 [Planctomycetota bacterium]